MPKAELIRHAFAFASFVASGVFYRDAIAIYPIHQFLTQVGVNTSVIPFVDKLVLGRRKRPIRDRQDWMMARRVRTRRPEREGVIAVHKETYFGSPDVWCGSRPAWSTA